MGQFESRLFSTLDQVDNSLFDYFPLSFTNLKALPLVLLAMLCPTNKNEAHYSNLSGPDYVGRQLKAKVSRVYWTALSPCNVEGKTFKGHCEAQFTEIDWELLPSGPADNAYAQPSQTRLLLNLREKSCITSGIDGFCAILPEYRGQWPAHQHLSWLTWCQSMSSKYLLSPDHFYPY